MYYTDEFYLLPTRRQPVTSPEQRSVRILGHFARVTVKYVGLSKLFSATRSLHSILHTDVQNGIASLYVREYVL